MNIGKKLYYSMDSTIQQLNLHKRFPIIYKNLFDFINYLLDIVSKKIKFLAYIYATLFSYYILFKLKKTCIIFTYYNNLNQKIPWYLSNGTNNGYKRHCMAVVHVPAPELLAAIPASTHGKKKQMQPYFICQVLI